jgi:hypothetical protein
MSNRSKPALPHYLQHTISELPLPHIILSLLPVLSDGVFVFKPPFVLISSNHRILHRWFAKTLSFAIPLARTFIAQSYEGERLAQIGISTAYYV